MNISHLRLLPFNRRRTGFHVNLRLFGMELEQMLEVRNYRERPNLSDVCGNTLLHIAADNSHDKFDIVEKLIKAGAYINAQNKWNQTPLHLAVCRHNWKVIDTLIAYNADINMKDLMGNTALHNVIDLLSSQISDDEQEMCSSIVKKLLRCGANPNISNSNRKSPLIIAVQCGNLGIVKDLLAFGANVHIRSKCSQTCLHFLSSCPKPDTAILNELVKHGACVNCYDDSGRTTLDVLLELNEEGYGIQLTKSFMKIFILVNWNHKIVFEVASQNREEFQSLETFADECYTEVSRMKSYIYFDGYTLGHFAKNGAKTTKKDKSQISIFIEVLSTLIKDEFPIYDDLIAAHFDKTFLKERLCEMNIYTRNTKVEVRLHPYAISHMISYLSVRDLLNLVRAFTKPFNNSLNEGETE